MVEYRTQPVEPTVLIEELSSFCHLAATKGTDSGILMFGWDSNLGIDEMWQDITLPLADIVDYVRAAEHTGTITVGKSDIFVKANGLEITLCHEGDLHISAEDAAAQQFLERWKSKGFMPFQVLPPVTEHKEPTGSRSASGRLRSMVMVCGFSAVVACYAEFNGRNRPEADLRATQPNLNIAYESTDLERPIC